jgi:hypothetical protein
MSPSPSNPAPQKVILSYLSPSSSNQNTNYEIHPSALPSYPNTPSSNLTFESRIVDIHDIRSKEKEFELDVHGFCFRRHETRVTNLKDERMVEERYLPEIESLLREELGEGVRVFVFGWKVSFFSSFFFDFDLDGWMRS